ncbi:helix-turn-helix transcriptional regulator [Kitasatospora camelliae]|uniref:Helix-turn-helix transcriptional regulator n=1 Tax=Kitasatospora camelliae TaxID=3156397 RepID=A0AAU8K5Z9_9ACTN
MPTTTAAALGARIETARLAAGLTRRRVEDLSGVSYGMIRHIEAGNRWPSDSILHALAHAIGTTPEALLDGPGRTDSRVHSAIPGIRQIIATYDLPDDGPIRPLNQVAQDVAAATRQRVDSQYGQLAEGVACLLAELFRAVDQGPDRERAAHLLALAVRSADAIAYKYGYHDLSGRLVEIMRWATNQTGDTALAAATAYVRTETYLASGHLAAGLKSLQRAADQISSPRGERATAAAGALHMRAAVVAGRMRDAGAAREHLAAATRYATAVREQLYDGTAVGPDSLEIHRLAVAVELGEPADLTEAVAAATRWVPPRSLPAERRSHYYIDLGRAQMALGRPQHARESMQVARQIAPQHVREHGQVRTELATMVRLDRGRDPQLLAFARWAKAI